MQDPTPCVNCGGNDRSHAAIALAAQKQAQVLLIDELRGRRIAENLGLSVAGTLNILAEAAARNWLDYHEAVQELREKTNFRVSDAIVSIAFREMPHDKQRER